MKFQIGGIYWGYELTSDAIDGDPTQEGGADRDRHLIQVSARCPADLRLSVFLHEYLHAWLFSVPRPRTIEEICDLFATATAALLRDLAHQGGIMALLSFGTGIVAANQPKTFQGALSPLEARTVRCEVCEQSIAPAAVVREPIDKHPKAGSPAVALSFYCEGCNHVQRWSELCSATGLPSGVTLDPVEHLRGKACADWCRRYPRESGIVFSD